MSQYGYYTSSRAGLEGGTGLGQQKRSWGEPVEQSGKRQRMENQELQRERQKLVETSTVSELASLRHPLDIPMPKFRSKNRSRSEDGNREKEDEE